MKIPVLSSFTSYISKRLITLQETPRNIRPALENWMNAGYDNVKINRPIIPYQDLYEMAEVCDTLATTINALTTEIFRNGWEFEEAFKSKCQNCDAEFDFMPEERICPDCDGPLRDPEQSQIKGLERVFKEGVNLNGDDLDFLCRTVNRDLEIADDGYILFVNSYLFDGSGRISDWKVREMMRVPPSKVAIIADDTGTLGRGRDGSKLFVCPDHRFELIRVLPKDWDEIQTEETPEGTDDYCACKKCEKAAYPAHYAIETPSIGNEQNTYAKLYYMEKEMIHTSKYRPSPLYGFSRVMTVWNKCVSLIYMDRYIKEWMIRGRSKGLFTLATSNAASAISAWKEKESLLKADPHDNSPLIVETESTGKGNIAQWTKTQDTPAELGLTEARNEFRREIGAEYGVMPIFMGDLSQAGGLNNEGLEVTVTNRAAAFGQSIWNTRFYPKMMKIFRVTDWRLVLKPSEEQDQMAELQRFAQKVTNARAMLDMGFDVKMTDDGQDFVFSGEAEKPQAQAFGFGEGSSPAPEKPESVPNAGASFEGTPQQKSDVKKFDVMSLVTPENLMIMSNIADATGVMLTASMIANVLGTTPENVIPAARRKIVELVNSYRKSESTMTSSTIGSYNPRHGRKIEMLARGHVEKAISELDGTYVRKARDTPTLNALSGLLSFLRGKLFSKGFEGVSETRSDRIKDAILDGMMLKKDPESIIEDVERIGKMRKSEAERIVLTEAQNLQNYTREYTFKQIDPEGKEKYKWLNPLDHRTSKTCRNIVDRTKKGVALEELKNIVKEEGGEHARGFTPHISCRSTFTMVV